MINRICWSLLFLFVAACGGDKVSPAGSAGIEMLTSPAIPGSAQAHLAQTTDGSVVMSWVEPKGDGHALKFSVFDGAKWQAARTVVQGDSWFVNWADFPSVEPISEDLWAAHWLEKQPGGRYAYNVAMSVSNDSGQSWSRTINPHTDGTATEHGFVSLFPVAGGIGALWLDGRNMTEDKPNAGGEMNHGIEGMTLRTATITPGLEIQEAQLVDELTCDCCQTDVAIGPDGPIAIYRNRDANEIRDIYIARSIAGKWRAPERVSDDGWRIAGCPVNGPAITTRDDQVAVAWFTAADNQPSVRMAFSSDAGVNFSNPVRIDDARPLGRVDIALLHNQDAIVSWLRKNEQGGSEISIRKVSPGGAIGDVVTVATTSASRASGFPQMVRSGDYLLFAWADATGESSKLLTARLAVDSL